MYNKVVLIGNVVKDVETKQLKDSSVAKIRMAIDDPFREKNTVYIDCEAWGDQASFAEKWLKKGSGIIVDGRLCMDSWEKDGKKETKIFVKAQEIRFSNVGSKNEKSEKNEQTSKPSNKSTSKTVEKETEDSEVPF
jgi:single-strand DNA-binding protein